jgi:hypothetical protein
MTCALRLSRNRVRNVPVSLFSCRGRSGSAPELYPAWFLRSRLLVLESHRVPYEYTLHTDVVINLNTEIVRPAVRTIEAAYRTGDVGLRNVIPPCILCILKPAWLKPCITCVLQMPHRAFVSLILHVCPYPALFPSVVASRTSIFVHGQSRRECLGAHPIWISDRTESDASLLCSSALRPGTSTQGGARGWPPLHPTEEQPACSHSSVLSRQAQSRQHLQRVHQETAHRPWKRPSPVEAARDTAKSVGRGGG